MHSAAGCDIGRLAWTIIEEAERRREIVRRIIAIIAIGAIIALAVSPALASSPSLSKVLTPSPSNTFVVKPSGIVFGTGLGFGWLHGGAFGSRMHWIVYNSTTARASGTADLNNCKPSCSTGSWSTTIGTATLTRPVNGRFTRLTVTYGSTTLHMRLAPFGSSWWWK
jgi:hypothetical protein